MASARDGATPECRMPVNPIRVMRPRQGLRCGHAMHARGIRTLAGRRAGATALLASLIAMTAIAVAGCASATATCTVRHHYAIVIFQNGMGNFGTRYVTSFLLIVRYPGGSVTRRQLVTPITLRAADGGNPPLMVRTYRVGQALSCAIGDIRAHR